jgi:hypothetical protein
VEYVQVREVWEEAEQVDEGREVAEAAVDDEVPDCVSEVTKGGLKLGFVVLESDEVDFEDAEGFDVSEVSEPFENVVVLGLVWWGVAQPPNVRRQNLSPFLRDILAPPFELRLVLKSDVMKQMALAPWSPRFRNKSAGPERSAEFATGDLSNIVDYLVDDFLVVVEHGGSRARGWGGMLALN